MDERGRSAREQEDREVERAIEELVEAVYDLNVAKQERESYVLNTPLPDQLRSFENLRAFLDYHWQVKTYNDAVHELDDALIGARDRHQEAIQRLWELFPPESPIAALHLPRRARRASKSVLRHHQAISGVSDREAVEAQ